MTQAKDYYENSTDKDSIRSIYRTGQNLEWKYDVMNKYAIHEQSFEEWAIKKLQLVGNEKILDVGAGNGRFSLPIAAKLKNNGGFIMAGDLSTGVLEESYIIANKDDLPMVHLRLDAEDLPFLSNEFDVVMANHMLYHVSNISNTLTEIRRVLKSRGIFLATTNSEKGMPELFSLHLQTMRELGIGFDHSKNHLTFSMENGEHMLRSFFNKVDKHSFDAGFEVDDPEPVLQYYMATQLYQGPFNDESINSDIRKLIQSTFYHFTEKALRLAGGKLRISKPVCAFICQYD
ncbi:methyltransferase domain-containing protein [Bacillus sp. FJAT-49732]|uniref:Methyltransferase domain-containing protein n=1 Tax=Lederbergia citrisecunda TaxID=2833583 RepID=A0A942TM87_9BACI|nr:class I SAM-dependent methyltransferase [Lederbergia citrisecunda]MBS4198562.1 methyltransferase domain-containing protein [Lederbergia citrisecunda]